MQTQKKRIHAWCLLRDQFAHVKPLEEAFGAQAEFAYDGEWCPVRLVKEKPDIVICVNDFHVDVGRCLEAAREQGVPSLILQDGILEWRCQYENPLFGDGGGAPQHQPVMADKIACLGAQSARQIAAWGNAGKVEVAGMPRLDYLLNSTAPALQRPGKRVLVMTAKNPGFTPEQRAVTVRSLKDVKACLDSRPNLEVFWRVSAKVVSELGVENQYEKAVSQELTALVKQVDAVITTPSTAILEAMLLQRPVAVLDYHNVPRFVPTAWTISAPEHVVPVVTEILDPPARKLAFQHDCLNDCLRCDSPASPRIAAMIRDIVRIAHNSREQGIPIRLPANMLESAPTTGTVMPVPLKELYPEQPVFSDTNIESLQLKVARLYGENLRLKNRLNSRNVTYLLFSKFCQWSRTTLVRPK